MSQPRIVAIDGPAGSGKSSICNFVATKMGWTYVNTGALYRAVGLIADESGIDLQDDAAVGKIVLDISEDLKWDATGSQLWYKDRDLTNDLVTVKAGNAASSVAKLTTVRKNLLPVQRDLAKKTPKGALVDGRDIGTVVFPDADLKIFLTATLDERAKRRFLQLQETGKLETNLSDDEKRRVMSELEESIAARDAQDSSRDNAPLKKADDAIEVDTSNMDIDSVVSVIVGYIEEKNL